MIAQPCPGEYDLQLSVFDLMSQVLHIQFAMWVQGSIVGLLDFQRYGMLLPIS
jgi:hypothetical protein